LNTLTRQILRFAAVGGVATGLHFMFALMGERVLQFDPGWANAFGFCFAFVWSLMANWAWTFEGQSPFKQAAPRFFALSGICFLLGQGIVVAATSQLHWPLWLALLPVVTIVPVLSFLGSKFHAFR
jgi:putative flippase GtrA